MASDSLNMTAPAETYRKRRARLASKLHRPMVLFAGQPRARNYATNTHPFRAGSNYLYFGGPPVAGAALLIEPGSNGEDGCLLAREVAGFEDIVWTGPPVSDENLSQACGLPLSALIKPDDVAGKVKGRTSAYLAPPCRSTCKWIDALGVQPATPDEVQPIVDMRLIKDEHELKAMRRAADVGVQAHLAAMSATAPGRGEADVVAAFHAVLVANQCHPSFSPIVTRDGEIFHGEGYPHTLQSGDLLLVDGGAEEPGGYAGDITRTYPVSGRFTDLQRNLYDVVLRAQRAAIAACVPGKRYLEVHDLAARVICEGLVELDLLRGDPEELTKRLAHTLFFAHGVGHLIGLDVHDLEEFGDQAGYSPGRSRRPEFGNKYLRLDRDLEPGMVVTIEPGIYLVPAIWQNNELTRPFADVVNRSAIDALLRDHFGGIRLEETICVRSDNESGPEVLTDKLPIDPDAVLEVVGSRVR